MREISDNLTAEEGWWLAIVDAVRRGRTNIVVLGRTIIIVITVNQPNIRDCLRINVQTRIVTRTIRKTRIGRVKESQRGHRDMRLLFAPSFIVVKLKFYYLFEIKFELYAKHSN